MDKEEIRDSVAATPAEAAELGAVESEIFYRYFFPQTFRQPSPPFARELSDALDDPANREVAFKCFRGSGKTARVRAFAAKRVSYAISRTIMVVSKTQDHAIRSVKWLKTQVIKNRLWAETFGLQKGDKWTDEEITIYHSVEDITITVIAVGISGQTRGLNVDDYRPDLIIVDDPCDGENTATPEQRKKISDEFFGSLQKSLAPPTEAPDGMMALLQTPFNEEDLIATCEKSGWEVKTYGCFTEEGESVWPDRFPTDFLLEEKKKHLNRNDTSLWYREMECKIVGEESAAFRQGWLQFYEPGEEPQKGLTVFGIDPASSESKNADDQVLLVLRVWAGNVYVLDYTAEKGEMPDAFADSFFALTSRWKALHGAAGAISYERVLSWYLSREMRRRLQFRTIHPIKGDKREKRDRIVQTLRPVASNGALWVRRDMATLIDQYSRYPDTQHDDVLDALAVAVEYAFTLGQDVMVESEDIFLDESDYAPLEFRGAP